MNLSQFRFRKCQILLKKLQRERLIAQKINETHSASLGEFEMAKEARKIADLELAELKEITRDIQRLIRDIEGKTNK